MKKEYLLFLGFLSFAGPVGAASCPSGFVAIDMPGVVIADVCPSGTVSIGVVDSCIVADSSGKCVVFDDNQVAENTPMQIINGRVYTESGILYAVSKAEMTSVGFSGRPCWYMMSSKSYKECLHSIINGRIGE